LEILYLSHCVPNPPDKGERIRAYHQVRSMCANHRVHVVCLARSEADERAAAEMNAWCASVAAVPFRPARELLRAGFHFALGDCLNTSYYGTPGVRREIARLAASTNLDAVVAFTAALAGLAPPSLPLLVDLVDVDSEKWFQYAKMRFPGWPYAIEGRRLRRVETALGVRARHLWLTTGAEAALYRSFGRGEVSVMENGIDAAYFDPAVSPVDLELQRRNFAVFVGTMDYYPNQDAVLWFAREVLPRVQPRGAEFYIVGRNPSAAVRELDGAGGVHVTGAVPDVRPYLRHARGFVAPLRLARGIQNKVLEALSMGLPVLASDPVADTFGSDPPRGLLRCAGAEDYERQWGAMTGFQEEIRLSARQRYRWEAALRGLEEQLSRIPRG
jgi:sugar transferase (PEP-CTERM/EpsH1 system associated)